MFAEFFHGMGVFAHNPEMIMEFAA